MKKILLLYMLFIACLVVSCKKETKAERYTKEARELTEQCPMLLDPYTQMDSLVYNEVGNKFIYYYTVLSLNPEQLKSQKDGLSNQLLNKLINSPEMKPYMQDNMIFEYIYRADDSGDTIMAFEFTPKMYKQ